MSKSATLTAPVAVETIPSPLPPGDAPPTQVPLDSAAGAMEASASAQEEGASAGPLAWLRRRDVRLVLALTLVAAFVRWSQLDFQSFWLDEAHSVVYSSVQSWQLLAQRMLKPGENGPLYFFLLSPWLAQFGRSETSVRGFSVLMSLPAIPLAYLAVSPLVGKRAALLSAAIFAFAPYVTWYAQEAKMYSLFLTGTLAALVTFMYACRGGRWWSWPAYALLAVGSIYVHFFSIFIIGSHAIAAWWLASGRRRWMAWATVAVVLVPIFLLELLAIRRDVAGSAAGGGFTASEQAGVLLYAFTLNVAPAPIAAVIFGAFLLLLVGTYLVLSTGRTWDVGAPRASGGSPASPSQTVRPIVLAVLFWVPLTGYAVVSVGLHSSLFADRYFITLTPFLYTLFSVTIVWLALQKKGLGLVAGALLAAAWLYGLDYQMTTPIKADFRSAASRYARDRQDGDVLVPLQNPQVFPFTYYTSQAGAPVDVVLADGPEQAKTMLNGEQVDFDALFDGRKRIWLVTSDVPDRYMALLQLNTWLGTHATSDLDLTYAGNVHLQRFVLTDAESADVPADAAS